jgi:prolyl oligopeptidase
MWGETIPDPYHWLENIDDQRVLNWAKKQNQTTFDYINQIPQRVKILKKLESISVKKEYKKAKRDGNYYFYTLTLEQPNKEIVYYSPAENLDEKLFVDPQLFSGNENARFASLSVSPDSKYAAFSLQDPLSKKEKIFIKDLETNRFLRDIVAASYNSTIAWDNEGGFFYNKRFSSSYSKDSVEHAVFYHVPGENPGRDIPVFAGDGYPHARNDLFITSNQRFVVIRSSVDENTSEIRYTDLNAPPPNTFKLITNKAGANAYIVDNIGEKLIILTNTGAPKGRVVVVDPKQPEVENWKTLISETQDIIQRVYPLGNKFYVRSSAHMSGKITAYDSSGSRLYSVELPGNGVVEGFSGRPNYSDVLYTYQSFNYPLTIFRYNPSRNKSEIFKQTETKIKSDDYVIKKEFCLTSEGIGIPLLIFHKKGMATDGSHPLILSFSGGMNESYMPGYSFGHIPFVDNGGVFVLASVRGGNEFDTKWHDAGAKKSKPQMERDVKECLDYLIQEKYTSAGKIGVLTKHAGAAAAIENAIKNPGLIKLVGIFQGIFDLTGYRNYKGCVGCIENELGNPDESKEVFDGLDEISPLRRSLESRIWPAVYLEHKIIDPVVSPVHSFKFIASLQDNSKDQLPKLIRIDNECCVQNRRQELFVLSERWAFAMYMLGVEVK